MASTPNGRFCWCELMTTDVDAAGDFYGRITGWTTTSWPGEGDTPYTLWMNGEMPVGGLMELPAEVAASGAPPCWLPYVSSPGVDATVAKVQSLGGGVLNQMDIAQVGRIAVIRDPQGGVVTVMEPEGDTPGHDGLPSVGEFSWYELATRDWEAAWSFYSDVFDWQETSRMDMGEMGFYQMFGRGAHPVGGMFNGPAEIPVGWLTYVRVPDVNTAAETVTELGGKVMNGPVQVPGGDLIAQCLDPQGVAFAIHATAGS